MMIRRLTSLACVLLVIAYFGSATGCSSEAPPPSKDDVTRFLDENPEIAKEAEAARERELKERNTNIPTPR